LRDGVIHKKGYGWGRRYWDLELAVRGIGFGYGK